MTDLKVTDNRMKSTDEIALAISNLILDVEIIQKNDVLPSTNTETDKKEYSALKEIVVLKEDAHHKKNFKK